jgi:hypothetical protein
MKRYRFKLVVFGLTTALVALLWIPSSSKTQGIVGGRELKVVSSVVVLPPKIQANNLTLIEFFAGY